MITIKENESQFYVGDSAEEPLAQIMFEREDGLIKLTHTDVSNTLKGQGVGQKLVAYAVDYARRNQVKIIPICPFTVNQFEKNPQYNDVVFE